MSKGEVYRSHSRLLSTPCRHLSPLPLLLMSLFLLNQAELLIVLLPSNPCTEKEAISIKIEIRYKKEDVQPGKPQGMRNNAYAISVSSP